MSSPLFLGSLKNTFTRYPPPASSQQHKGRTIFDLLRIRNAATDATDATVATSNKQQATSADWQGIERSTQRKRTQVIMTFGNGTIDWEEILPGACPWNERILPYLQAMRKEAEKGHDVWLNRANFKETYLSSGDVTHDLDCMVKVHVVLWIRLSVVTGDMSWLGEEVISGLRCTHHAIFQAGSVEEKMGCYLGLLEVMCCIKYACSLVPPGWKDPFRIPEEYRWGDYAGYVANVCGGTNLTALRVLFYVATGRTCRSYTDGRTTGDDGGVDGTIGVVGGDVFVRKEVCLDVVHK